MHMHTSPVIDSWIITIQDSMPEQMRNSLQWKTLLSAVADIGQAHEQERIQLIADWMFRTVLPILQPTADDHGFGQEWASMTIEKSQSAAVVAMIAAERAMAASGIALAEPAERAMEAAGWALMGLVEAAAAETAAAAVAVAAIEKGNVWEKLNPPELLAALIAVSETEDDLINEI